MLFLIWGLLIICGLLFPKSKTVSVMMIGYMIAVIGFRTQGADYIIYQNEFKWSKYQMFSDVHYVGYLVLEQYAHKWGIPFKQFLLIVGSSSCLLMYYGISRLTSRVNSVLALFFVYPFAHEAIQTRTFLANSILIAALPLILKEPLYENSDRNVSRKEKILRTILFYMLAVLACTFHFEAAIYVVFLTMMIFLPEKYGKLYVIGSAITVFLLIETDVLPKIVEQFNSRIAYWLSGKTGLGILIPIAISLVIWYAMQIAGTACARQSSGDLKEQAFCKKILRLSDCIFLLIPLFCYDITFNRLWRLFLLMLYIMVTKAFPGRMSKNTRLWIVFLLIVLFISVCVYENVFSLLYGVLKNNAIFGSLSVL